MVTKAKKKIKAPSMPVKEVVKDLAKPKEPSKKQCRYVAIRNLDKMKEAGWKEVKEKADKHGKTLGVNTNMGSVGTPDNNADLVLMEK